jgi:hypothetical protein
MTIEIAAHLPLVNAPLNHVWLLINRIGEEARKTPRRKQAALAIAA